MSKHTDVNGVPFTDDDIERWAAGAESGRGYTGRHLGPVWARRLARSPFASTQRAEPSLTR